MSEFDTPWTARTLAAQAMGKIDAPSRALVPPIHVATTFLRDPDNAYSSGNVYGRADNETVREAEAVLRALEGAAAAMVFGSGMSSALALFLALPAGAHVVAPRVMYWALRNWLLTEAPRHGLEVTFADLETPGGLAAALQPGRTRAVWLETPSNPLWGVSDIAAAAELAHAAGAIVAVDSTCATPVFTRPLELGADVVMHSATKYLGGHGDLTAGIAVFADAELAMNVRLYGLKDMTGAVMSAQDAHLVMRGLKTLSLRLDRHCDSAETIAKVLEAHTITDKVCYPGLASFAQHELATRQMKRYGGMIAFELKGGMQAGIRFMDALRLVTRAVSLGDAESLAQHPASMTHSTYTPEQRAAHGISDGLIRLSVGLEDVQDILADLQQALDQVAMS